MSTFLSQSNPVVLSPIHLPMFANAPQAIDPLYYHPKVSWSSIQTKKFHFFLHILEYGIPATIAKG